MRGIEIEIRYFPTRHSGTRTIITRISHHLPATGSMQAGLEARYIFLVPRQERCRNLYIITSYLDAFYVFILSTNYLQPNMYIHLCMTYPQLRLNTHRHLLFTPLIRLQHPIYQPPYGSSSSIPASTAAARAASSLCSASRASLSLASALARCS